MIDTSVFMRPSTSVDAIRSLSSWSPRLVERVGSICTRATPSYMGVFKKMYANTAHITKAVNPRIRAFRLATVRQISATESCCGAIARCSIAVGELRTASACGYLISPCWFSTGEMSSLMSALGNSYDGSHSHSQSEAGQSASREFLNVIEEKKLYRPVPASTT